MQREIVGFLKARDGAGGEVLLRPGAVVNGFHIERSSKPEEQVYLARFKWERRDLTSPLYAFLPRTRILETVTEHATIAAPTIKA